MVGLSVIGRAGAIWIAITLALVVLDRSRMRGAVEVLVALTLAFATTDLVIKPLVARARPFDAAVATRVIDRRPLTIVRGHTRADRAFDVRVHRRRGVPGFTIAPERGG